MPEILGLPLFSDANLISYYRLEDVSDSKGSNTLTNNGSVAFNAAVFNNGGDLGASNSSKSLTVGGNMGIAGAGDFTFSFWLKLRTEISSGAYRLISWNSQLTDDRYVDISYEYNSGTPRITVDASGGTGIAYNITLGTSNFYHIVITRSSGTTTLYINGVAVGGTGTTGASAGGANIFYIGMNIASSNYTSAIYDDLAVFNRVLDPSEVWSIYSASLGTMDLNSKMW